MRAYIVSNGEYVVEGLRLRVVFRCHEERVEQDTQDDEQVKHGLRDDGEAHLLPVKPPDEEAAATAVVAAHRVPVDQRALLTIGHEVALANWQHTQGIIIFVSSQKSEES